MSKKFLILGSVNYANRRILHELQQMGHEAEILDPSRLLPYVTDTKNDRIYVTTSNSEEPRRIYKKTVSCIIPRVGSGLSFYAKSVEHINLNIGVPSTATANGLLTAQDKVRTIQVLSRKGIKTPRTFAAKNAQNLTWIVKQLGGFPVVAKLLFGSQGVGVFILTESLSAKTGLDAFTSQGHPLLIQQFIETAKRNENKHDFRAVVVNGEVVAAIRRNSVGDDFRTNASLKEDCEGVELDAEMKQIAINSAAACGLACAGVDIAKDVNTGEIYVYEVNGNFNFKSTEKYSRKNVAQKIANYAVSISSDATGKVDEEMKAFAVKMREMSDFPQYQEREAVNELFVSAMSTVKGIPFLHFPDDQTDTNDGFLDDPLEMCAFGKKPPQTKLERFNASINASIGR